MSVPKQGRGPSRRRIIVSTLGITQTLAWGSTYYLPAIFADRISADLHMSREWFFAVFSGALLLSGLLGPLAGRAIDKHGGRDVLAATNLVFAAGLVALAFASNAVGLVLAWTILGIGMGFGLYEASFATVTGLWGRDARNAITGITLFAGFASTVGWPLSAEGGAPSGRPGAPATPAGGIRQPDTKEVATPFAPIDADYSTTSVGAI